MVSIIVPAYNAEKCIIACVESLVNQTYRDIEIILVNDGSTDSTASILDELRKKDARIKVINKKNGGVSSARNTGIKAAKGEYIMFCDSDDIPDLKWCEELAACAEKYPDRMPVCGYRCVYPNSDKESLVHAVAKPIKNDEGYSFYETKDILLLLESAVFFSPWNKLYKTEIIHSNCLIFDETLSLGEDCVFNLNYVFFLGGRIADTNKILYVYLQQNETSLSRVLTENMYYYESVYKYYKKLLLVSDCSKKDCDRVYAYFFHKYTDLMFSQIKGKKQSRSSRISFCKKLISLPGFNDCVKNIDLNCIDAKRICKMAKRGWPLLIYVYMKILLT